MAPLLEPLQFQPSVGFRARRVTFVYPVLVKPLGVRLPAMRVHSTNLSLGGMFIYALQPPPMGTRVKIFLDVRGRLLELGEGEVRWARGTAFSSYPWCPGFGVRFAPLSARSQALVQHLVASAIEQGDQVKPATRHEEDGVPVPGVSLPKIAGLDEPLDKDYATQQMFPVAKAELEAAGAELERPDAARPQDLRRWRWVRWALAAAATAAWVAAFSQINKSNDTAPRAAARNARPADVRR